MAVNSDEMIPTTSPVRSTSCTIDATRDCIKVPLKSLAVVGSFEKNELLPSPPQSGRQVLGDEGVNVDDLDGPIPDQYIPSIRCIHDPEDFSLGRMQSTLSPQRGLRRRVMMPVLSVHKTLDGKRLHLDDTELHISAYSLNEGLPDSGDASSLFGAACNESLQQIYEECDRTNCHSSTSDCYIGARFLDDEEEEEEDVVQAEDEHNLNENESASYTDSPGDWSESGVP